MNNTIVKILLLLFISVFTHKTIVAQLSPINFEPTGNGYNWTWTTFENGSNPPVQIVANPNTTGINTSANVIQMTTLQTGMPWAGFESLHGAGIGTFTLSTSNCIVKVMVYKSVISDVGVKFVTASGASTGEIKKPNTVINQWEELTFDFSAKIPEPSSTNIDQIVIFPDFQTRTTDNICYIDNINLGVQNIPTNINVKFAAQSPDSTPVYVFGNWNNWSNFPGTLMTFNTTTGNYEATLPLTSASTIEYLYVNGTQTKETLNSDWTCTNGNSQYTNRKTTLGNNDTTLCNIWSSCNTCNALSLPKEVNQDFSLFIQSNIMNIHSTSIYYFDNLEIVDVFGRRLYSSMEKIPTNTNINLSLKANQIIIIRLKKENKFYNLKQTI